MKEGKTRAFSVYFLFKNLIKVVTMGAIFFNMTEY